MVHAKKEHRVFEDSVVLCLCKKSIQRIEITKINSDEFHIFRLLSCQFRHTLDRKLKRVIQIVHYCDCIVILQQAKGRMGPNES